MCTILEIKDIGEKPGNNDANIAKGRRLFIGNIAYATTEKELTEFFKGYLV
jgi:RNA recognition motif-containing protein